MKTKMKIKKLLFSLTLPLIVAGNLSSQSKTSLKAIDEMKDAGAYEYYFNESNFSSGIYFCHLTARDFLETKKMILLR